MADREVSLLEPRRSSRLRNVKEADYSCDSIIVQELTVSSRRGRKPQKKKNAQSEAESVNKGKKGRASKKKDKTSISDKSQVIKTEADMTEVIKSRTMSTYLDESVIQQKITLKEQREIEKTFSNRTRRNLKQCLLSVDITDSDDSEHRKSDLGESYAASKKNISHDKSELAPKKSGLKRKGRNLSKCELSDERESSSTNHLPSNTTINNMTIMMDPDAELDKTGCHESSMVNIDAEQPLDEEANQMRQRSLCAETSQINQRSERKKVKLSDQETVQLTNKKTRAALNRTGSVSVDNITDSRISRFSDSHTEAETSHRRHRHKINSDVVERRSDEHIADKVSVSSDIVDLPSVARAAVEARVSISSVDDDDHCNISAAVVAAEQSFTVRRKRKNPDKISLESSFWDEGVLTTADEFGQHMCVDTGRGDSDGASREATNSSTSQSTVSSAHDQVVKGDKTQNERSTKKSNRSMNKSTADTGMGCSMSTSETLLISPGSDHITKSSNKANKSINKSRHDDNVKKSPTHTHEMQSVKSNVVVDQTTGDQTADKSALRRDKSVYESGCEVIGKSNHFTDGITHASNIDCGRGDDKDAASDRDAGRDRDLESDRDSGGERDVVEREAEIGGDIECGRESDVETMVDAGAAVVENRRESASVTRLSNLQQDTTKPNDVCTSSSVNTSVNKSVRGESSLSLCDTGMESCTMSAPTTHCLPAQVEFPVPAPVGDLPSSIKAKNMSASRHKMSTSLENQVLATDSVGEGHNMSLEREEGNLLIANKSWTDSSEDKRKSMRRRSSLARGRISLAKPLLAAGTPEKCSHILEDVPADLANDVRLQRLCRSAIENAVLCVERDQPGLEQMQQFRVHVLDAVDTEMLQVEKKVIFQEATKKECIQVNPVNSHLDQVIIELEKYRNKLKSEELDWTSLVEKQSQLADEADREIEYVHEHPIEADMAILTPEQREFLTSAPDIPAAQRQMQSLRRTAILAVDELCKVARTVEMVRGVTETWLQNQTRAIRALSNFQEEDPRDLVDGFLKLNV